jgi:elongation factor P
MKVQANAVRPGNVLEISGKLWVATRTQIVQPGKGGAFVQIEMKEIKAGTKTTERYRTQETVERAILDEREYTFLFAEGDNLTFMDKESFEQISLPREDVGDQAAFLQEGMTVEIETHEGSPIGVHLPVTVIMTVTESDPVVKGQTATSSYKPAILENGVRILVPPFIEAGEKIVVNTQEASYVERAKG